MLIYKLIIIKVQLPKFEVRYQVNKHQNRRKCENGRTEFNLLFCHYQKEKKRH